MRFEDSEPMFKPTDARIVYVIDDDSDLRLSMRFLLKTMNVRSLPYADGAQFLRELETLQPAPIFLDLRMPIISGMEVLADLKSRKNDWPVIVLTGHGEVGVAVQAFKIGAIDFLEKPVPLTDLMQAIESAFYKLRQQTAVEGTRNEAAVRLALLTPREFEVLESLCCGRSNKQVAFDMSLSTRTVEMHRANAFRQLGVRSVVEALAIRTAADK